MEEVVIIAKGRVQGVFFRAGCRAKASELNLSGYAKNLDNGDVEVLIQGSRHAIDKFVDWIRVGPEGAKVENIMVTSAKPEETFTGFKIL
ncbi:acylphosphatase [Candidatus Peregrinibacteria bacterium]|nr:acylphosphatase [Candidatus Peregrinibacteria bacterium]